MNYKQRIGAYKPKNPKGYGLSVILVFFPFLSLFTMFSAMATKINKLPKVLIGNISLGSTTIWGVPVFLYGSLMTLGFAMSLEDSIEWVILFTSAIPAAITGLGLIFCRRRYDRHLFRMDLFLEKVVFVEPEIPMMAKVNLPGNKMIGFASYLWLDELYHQGLLSYEKQKNDKGEQVFVLKSISDELKTMYNVPGIPGKTKVETSQRTEEWECPQCGASNHTRFCEYCGSAYKPNV